MMKLDLLNIRSLKKIVKLFIAKDIGVNSTFFVIKSRTKAAQKNIFVIIFENFRFSSRKHSQSEKR